MCTAIVKQHELEDKREKKEIAARSIDCQRERVDYMLVLWGIPNSWYMAWSVPCVAEEYVVKIISKGIQYPSPFASPLQIFRL